ncbi:MAG: SDR family oxidoreductase [Acidobacteria bacterium]|nr:SDR family oxidoreductase [Acidobacteriota bacterium]
MRLDGKVALITGGGTGIGTAITERFVEEGAKVCISGRRQSVLDKVARSLPEGMVSTCAGDVTRFEDCRRMVDTTLSFGGKIDVLINNAAIDPGGAVLDLSPELWRQVLDINLTGPFLMTKAALQPMIRAGGGSVINISALGGMRCLPGMPAYCTSKAGLNHFTKQVALDYGPANIRCNAVCPGGTRTEMLSEALTPVAEAMGTDVEGVYERMASNVPLRRIASASEVSGICVYLAGEDSSYMTGAVLLLDGGAAVVDVAGAALSDSGNKWGASDTRE